MNSEISNQQNRFNEYSDWFAQVDNVNDKEASQINGGISSVELDLGSISSRNDEFAASAQGLIEEQFRTSIINMTTNTMLSIYRKFGNFKVS